MENKIITLFLDIGGVLLSNGWGHEFRHLGAEKFQLDKAEMEERHSIMFVTYQEGKITLKEYLERVGFYKHRNFSYKKFRDFMFGLSTSHWEVIAFIKKLKAKYGLKIVTVSNEATELNAYRIQTFGLNSFIDFFISSCYVRLRKADKAIFKIAPDKAQVTLEEAIYIDDVQMFTDRATEIRIKSILHTDTLSTCKALTALGFQTNKMKTVNG